MRTIRWVLLVASLCVVSSTFAAEVKTGGAKMIPLDGGKYNVWTKRVGNNPRIKVLLLHGGPGATHEYFEAFDSFFPAAGFEYYYYDQLGSAFSDQPDIAELWDVGQPISKDSPNENGMF